MFKRFIAILALFSLIVVLFGQLVFQFLNYHFHLTSLSVPFIFVVLFYTVFHNLLSLKDANFRKGDFIFLIFLSYVVISFAYLGKSNSLEFIFRILLIIFGAFFVGRTLSSSILQMGFRLFCVVFVLDALVLVYEMFQDFSIIRNGRFILYDIGEDFGSGSSTQAFVSNSFAPAFIFLFSLEGTKKYRLFRHAGLILTLTFLVLFGSRSSTIAVALATIFSFIFWKGNSIINVIKICSGIVLFCSLLYLLIPSTRFEFFSEAFRGVGSADARLLLFSDAWFLFSDSKLFGIGASNYGHLYSFKIADFASPHSLFLHILVELGLCGFLLFFSLVIYIFRKSYFFKELYQNKGCLYLYPLFTYWIFLLIDMQSYGNYFYDYHWYVVTGVLVSLLKTRNHYEYKFY